jgi:hypothetical protein
MKAWMGATHFLMRRRHKVATEMALNVLAYNMKRVIAILGFVGPLETCREQLGMSAQRGRPEVLDAGSNRCF